MYGGACEVTHHCYQKCITPEALLRNADDWHPCVYVLDSASYTAWACSIATHSIDEKYKSIYCPRNLSGIAVEGYGLIYLTHQLRTACFSSLSISCLVMAPDIYIYTLRWH